MRSFQTKRLLASTIQESDTPAIDPIWSDPSVTEFLNIEPIHSFDDTVQRIRTLQQKAVERRAVRYTLIRKDTKEVVGTAGFNRLDLDHKVGEIGYELAEAHWGQGFGTEIVEALHSVALHGFGLETLQAIVHEDNVRSSHLLEKLHFHEVPFDRPNKKCYEKSLLH